MSLKETLESVDESLIKRAASGEFAAFEELVQLYKRPLWKFVYRLLGDYEDSNDAIQQILIQVYCSLPSLDNYSSFRAWLFMIARNKCIDQLRRNSNQKNAELNSANGPDSGPGGEADNCSPLQLFPDPAPLPDELVERSETRRLLQEAIMTLPERSRQVVSLRYTTDLSFSEIGETLGMNENTAKTLFQRAKNQLRFYIRQRL